MNLVIDEGNTSVKIGVFDNSKLIKVTQFLSLIQAKEYINSINYNEVIYSTVREHQSVTSFFHKKPLFLTNKTKLPIKVNYKTPDTLGVDRLALAVGVSQKIKKKNVLMIDAGTCITCDLLENNVYSGGVITLGIQMRAKALHEFTGKLPLIKPSITQGILGKDTFESLNSGVINGVVGEIKEIVDRFEKEYGIEEVFITGGDANYFDNKFKTPTFVNPFLVLEGLNRILEYNV